MSATLKVRAIKDGFYDNVYRREGEEFMLDDKSAFSAKWMAAIDEEGNALKRQPVKGDLSSEQVSDAADAALGTQGAVQANRESAMSATLGQLERVVDTSTAADPNAPDPLDHDSNGKKGGSLSKGQR